MEHILNKNNIGIEHICNGRCEQARKAFKEALVTLHTYHQQQKAGQSFRCNVPIHIENQRIPDSPDRSSPSNNIYMYRNVMLARLRSTSKTEHDTTEQNINYLAVLITFNLCLTLHYKLDREFNSSRSSNVIQQNKLLLLYKKVWKELLIDTRKTPRHKPYRDTLSFALLNNMGGIFHQQANKEKVWNCFKSLKNLISRANSCTIAADLRNGVMSNILLVEDASENTVQVLPPLVR